MTTHTMSEETTFYGELQKSRELDLWDNRGKRHDLSFILLSLLIEFIRNAPRIDSEFGTDSFNSIEASFTDKYISSIVIAKRKLKLYPKGKEYFAIVV